MNTALQKAFNHLGGQAELARKIKVSRQRLHAWFWLDRRIPPEYCVAIEVATDRKVSRKSLRPDFPWGDL